MDLIPPESFQVILRHLSERDRLRVLRTCKRMREWLQKRESMAQAAFDAFKAHCVTVGWRMHDDDQTARISGALSFQRGTHRWSHTVTLEENSLISVLSTDRFTLCSGVVLPYPNSVCFFSPWFHTTTSRRGRKPDTAVPDDVLQMLLNASPRLT